MYIEYKTRTPAVIRYLRVFELDYFTLTLKKELYTPKYKFEDLFREISKVSNVVTDLNLISSHFKTVCSIAWQLRSDVLCESLLLLT